MLPRPAGRVYYPWGGVGGGPKRQLPDPTGRTAGGKERHVPTRLMTPWFRQIFNKVDAGGLCKAWRQHSSGHCVSVCICVFCCFCVCVWLGSEASVVLGSSWDHFFRSFEIHMELSVDRFHSLGTPLDIPSAAAM